MDVAGALPQGGRDDDIDEIDHRGLVGHDLDVVEVVALLWPVARRPEVLDHPLHGHLVGGFDLFQDVVATGDRLLDLEPAEEAHILDDALITGIGRGDAQCAVRNLERKNLRFADEFRAESFARGLGNA